VGLQVEDTEEEEVGTSGELAAEALREAEEHTETEGLRVPVSVADTDTLPVGEMLPGTATLLALAVCSTLPVVRGLEGDCVALRVGVGDSVGDGVAVGVNVESAVGVVGGV
jgi:hypothetical protein